MTDKILEMPKLGIWAAVCRAVYRHVSALWFYEQGWQQVDGQRYVMGLAEYLRER